MRTNLAILTWVVLLISVVSLAWAQGRGGRPAPTESLSGEATVKGVRPGVLQVMTGDGKDWLVSVPVQPESVVFRGAATTQFLQPRMSVRFHAIFKKTEKRRKEYQATQSVTSLEIITVRPGGEPNVYPDDAKEGRDAPLPDNEGAGPEQKKAIPPATDELACLVIGTLTEYKNNKIKVAAGPFVVAAELPETAEVSVDVRHCLWVRPGDKVELNARYFLAMPGQAEGQQLTITAAQPLTTEERAGKGRRPGRDRKQEEVRKAN